MRKLLIALSVTSILMAGIIAGMFALAYNSVELIPYKSPHQIYNTTLEVQNSEAIQPFGFTYEDETTGAMVLQPAPYHNHLQYQKHAWFLQGTEYVKYWTLDPQQEARQ